MERSIRKYARAQFTLPNGCKTAELLAPDGTKEALHPFRYLPTAFSYDHHGYELETVTGEEQLCVRVTPDQEGLYTLLADGEAIETFACVPSECPGYVEVSKKDPRYFAYSDGTSYVPIGLNMIGTDYDRLPAGYDHFNASNLTATTGLVQMRRYFRELKKAKANYVRLWLSNGYFNARTEVMGVHDLKVFNRLDAVMELARESGVRVKMCFEHFRMFTFNPAANDSFAFKRIVDPDTGKQMTDEKAWVNEKKWNDRWMEDIYPYLARYSNDPVVFAWELWNEMNCVRTGDFADIAAFTRRMLPRVKALSPKNLAVNSLGSFDDDNFQREQDIFKGIEEMDFLQVHRYLDQGAPMEICRTDPVAFSIDAVQRARLLTKPLIFTETGAVNDRHVGPFRFYVCDHDGLIFHDTTYPALFAGAAGSGHIWHWNQYVEPKNLWRHYLPLANLVEGLQMDEEGFESIDLSTDTCWVLGLQGKQHTLLFLRNKTDRWDLILRDNKEPETIPSLRLPLAGAAAKTYFLMDEQGEEAFFDGNALVTPSFLHGCVIRITHN